MRVLLTFISLFGVFTSSLPKAIAAIDIANVEPIALPFSPEIALSWSAQRLSVDYQVRFHKPIFADFDVDLSHNSKYRVVDFVYAYVYQTTAAMGSTYDREIPLPPATLKKMADFCNSTYTSMYDRVACASVNADHLSDESPVYKDHPDGPCRTIDSYFRSILQAMNDHVITRNLRISIINFADHTYGRHVVTLVTMPDNQGYQQTYAVDSMNFPHRFYPYTDVTKNFHDNHGRKL